MCMWQDTDSLVNYFFLLQRAFPTRFSRQTVRIGEEKRKAEWREEQVKSKRQQGDGPLHSICSSVVIWICFGQTKTSGLTKAKRSESERQVARQKMDRDAGQRCIFSCAYIYLAFCNFRGEKFSVQIWYMRILNGLHFYCRPLSPSTARRILQI